MVAAITFFNNIERYEDRSIMQVVSNHCADRFFVYRGKRRQKDSLFFNMDSFVDIIKEYRII